MTWYRVGPAGIPGSLKTDMDAVLNKKFGTSTTYAPNTWPDNVNLLGPLPVKTASGAIVSFADGADDVPLASASFGIVPAGGGGTPSDPVAITGYSGMTITHTDGQTPPVESETISDTFGRTVYGGTRALNGTLTITHVIKEYAVADMNNSDNYPGWRNAGVKDLGITGGYHSAVLNIGSGKGYGVNVSGSNDILYLTVGDFGMTQTQWLANYPYLTVQIIIELPTPLTYALDPLSMSSYYGANNIYTDISGATNSVDYRADIQLALNA